MESKGSLSQTSVADQNLISLCTKAVNLTNNVDIHLTDASESLEIQYSSLRSFTTKFNRLREILWQIQAELTDLAKADVFLPYKSSQALSSRLQLAVHDLVSCELIVVKLITKSRKTGFGKFMQGFKPSMDTEIMTLGDALGRHREALREAWETVNKAVAQSNQRPAPIAKEVGWDRKMSMGDLPAHPAVRIAKPDAFEFDLPERSYPRREDSMRGAVRPPVEAPYTPRSGRAQLDASMDSSGSSSYRNKSVMSAETPMTETESWPTNGVPMMKSALGTALQRRDPEGLHRLLRSHEGTIPPSSLTQAVGSNDIPSVRLLVTYGVPVDGVDSDGNTGLLVAVATWSIDAARILLQHGADPEFCPKDAELSPFVLAARQNQVELLQLMLDHGANANAALAKGDFPLNTCICQGVKAEVVAVLLAAGANPNTKTKDGKTPLVEALTIKRLDFVKLLLEHGANPNLAGPKHPLWPATYLPPALKLLIEKGAKTRMASGNIELAASLNNIESIQILLDAGVSPNEKKDGVYTPLCSAIRDDRADIVKLLLAHKADPNLMASEYPAWKCISHGRLHFLPSLVAAGADLHVPPGIAELAVSYNNKEALMYLLLNRVDVNKANEDGKTALTTAIREGRRDLVDVLLSHGAKVTARGEDWPLVMALNDPALLKHLLQHVDNFKSVTKGIIELAVKADELESVKILVEAGISVEDRTGGVFSPLTSALRENHKDIVRYLVDEAGADVNSPGEHLPLIKAIRRRTDLTHNDMIEFLLERGADINLLYRGWNAIMQAIEMGDKKLLHILIEKGNGIDLQAVDTSSEQTVYEMIQDRGWAEGIEMLMEHRNQVRMLTDGSSTKS